MRNISQNKNKNELFISQLRESVNGRLPFKLNLVNLRLKKYFCCKFCDAKLVNYSKARLNHEFNIVRIILAA